MIEININLDIQTENIDISISEFQEERAIEENNCDNSDKSFFMSFTFT